MGRTSYYKINAKKGVSTLRQALTDELISEWAYCCALIILASDVASCSGICIRLRPELLRMTLCPLWTPPGAVPMFYICYVD